MRMHFSVNVSRQINEGFSALDSLRTFMTIPLNTSVWIFVLLANLNDRNVCLSCTDFESRPEFFVLGDDEADVSPPKVVCTQADASRASI